MYPIFLKTYPFLLSFLLGLIPALIWLWFWLKEDAHPEPAKNITLSFLGGSIRDRISAPYTSIIAIKLLQNCQIATLHQPCGICCLATFVRHIPNAA